MLKPFYLEENAVWGLVLGSWGSGVIGIVPSGTPPYSPMMAEGGDTPPLEAPVMPLPEQDARTPSPEASSDEGQLGWVAQKS